MYIYIYIYTYMLQYSKWTAAGDVSQFIEYWHIAQEALPGFGSQQHIKPEVVFQACPLSISYLRDRGSEIQGQLGDMRPKMFRKRKILLLKMIWNRYNKYYHYSSQSGWNYWILFSLIKKHFLDLETSFLQFLSRGQTPWFWNYGGGSLSCVYSSIYLAVH